MEANIGLARQRVGDSGRVTCEVVIGKPWRKRRLSATMESYLLRRKRRRLSPTIATLLLVLAITAVVGLGMLAITAVAQATKEFVAGPYKEGEKVRFGFHNLRHSLASFLVRKGTDVKTVQKMLHHSDVSTTLGIYADSMSEDRLAALVDMLTAMMTPSNLVN